MAWLAERIPEFKGSGIVYTLTVRDADNLAAWLRRCGIDPRAYHGGLGWMERKQLEDMLLANQVKAPASGGTLRDVQEQLRHASAATTANVYVQAVPESVRETVEKMDRALRKKAKAAKEKV